MAYNPNLYNAFGTNQFLQPQFPSPTPVNGLVEIDSIQGGEMYYLPPNSVSPPLFLRNENAFLIKRTDGGGASTLKKYNFEEAELPTNNNAGDFVTRDYFDKKMNEVMEAFNGKHTIPGQQWPAATGQESSAASIQPNQVAGAIQPDVQSNV